MKNFHEMVKQKPNSTPLLWCEDKDSQKNKKDKLYTVKNPMERRQGRKFQF